MKEALAIIAVIAGLILVTLEPHDTRLACLDAGFAPAHCQQYP